MALEALMGCSSVQMFEVCIPSGSIYNKSFSISAMGVHFVQQMVCVNHKDYAGLNLVNL